MAGAEEQATDEYFKNFKVVYEQEDVFVHTAVPTSTFYDNIIRGKLSIVEKNNETFVDWQPLSDLTPELEYEVHSLFSGPIEYGVVLKQDPQTGSDKATNSKPSSSNIQHEAYKVCFDIQAIHSIRRSDPRLAWSYVVFILRDGTTQPALHFHDGGIKEMISCLQRYIWLTRSPVNRKLYIVQERDGAMESTLNQFELFADKPGDVVSKFFNNTYYGTLSGFSKVTQYVLGSIGQQDLHERRPPRNNVNTNVNNTTEEYEILAHDEPDILGPVIPVARGAALQPEEWCAFMDNNGRINDVERLKERVFRGGIHADIQREAWKFLLGYFKFNSTYEERAEHKSKRTDLYYIMKSQWKCITPEQESRFTEFANRKHLVDKDAIRTDRKIQFFEGENNANVNKLFDILMTYCMYNFDLGYVQGMSDLLSPILMLMEDEVDSFWCFVGLMELEERNFELTQHLMKQQLENLGKLVSYMYPNFSTYLQTHEADNLYFCFRWILISFKRDFGTGDIMTLWEVLWTQNLTPHFKLFICLAIIEREKDTMIKNQYGFNEILKHINDLAYNIDLQYVLSRAESICLQLKQTENLPKEIKDLLDYHREIDGGDDNDDDDDIIERLKKKTSSNSVVEDDVYNCSVESVSNLNHDSHDNERNADEAVVELKENTQSVF